MGKIKTLTMLLIGIAIVLSLVVSFPLARRQWMLLYVLLFLGGACAIMMKTMRSARRWFDCNLLVPFGLRCAFMMILAWLATSTALGAWLTPSWNASLFHFPITISLWFVLAAVAHLVYVAWITPLIVRASEGQELSLSDGMTRGLRTIGRAAILLVIGVGGSLLAISVGALQWLTEGNGPFFLLPALLTTIAWNVATAPMVLVCLTSNEGLRTSIPKSFRIANECWKSWFLPVAALTLLLGAATYSHTAVWSISEDQPTRTHQAEDWVVHRPQSHHSESISTNTRWTRSSVWTGAYAQESKWSINLAEALRVPPLSIVEFVLGLLLGILSILVKIHVWRVIQFEERIDSRCQRTAATPLALIVVAMSLLGCTDRTTRPDDRMKLIESEFMAPARDCFHVRSARYSMDSDFFMRDGDEEPRSLLKEEFFSWITQHAQPVCLLEYVSSVNGVFRVEIADRRNDATWEEDESSEAAACQLVAFEQRVKAGQKLRLAIGFRCHALIPAHLDEEDPTLVGVALLGGHGDVRAWPSSAAIETKQRGGILGSFVSCSIPKRLRFDAVYSNIGPIIMPVPDWQVEDHWLSRSVNTWFPVCVWADSSPFKGNRSGSREGRSKGVHVRMESADLVIRTDGVVSTFERDGIVSSDFTTWESPAWLARGRFISDESKEPQEAR